MSFGKRYGYLELNFIQDFIMHPLESLNKPNPLQNGPHFADDMLKGIFIKENHRITFFKSDWNCLWGYVLSSYLLGAESKMPHGAMLCY